MNSRHDTFGELTEARKLEEASSGEHQEEKASSVESSNE
jgi:hypothetical protein